MSFFTTNLLITLRLIKDLKQKRLYTQNSQETCLLDLYRDMSLESICNFPVKGGFIAKCWITATATEVMWKTWQSLKGCSPSSARLLQCPALPQAQRPLPFYTLAPAGSSHTRGLGSPKSLRWVQLWHLLLLIMLSVHTFGYLGLKGNAKSLWKKVLKLACHSLILSIDVLDEQATDMRGCFLLSPQFLEGAWLKYRTLRRGQICIWLNKLCLTIWARCPTNN